MGQPLGTRSATAGEGSSIFSHPLRSLASCQTTLIDLLEADPTRLGWEDLGTLNLLCAPNLPGSEGLDLARCLSRLDRLSAFVKAGTERHRDRFRSDPEYGHSEAMWRMAMLVTLVKRDFGAAYNPTARDELLAGIESPITDSRDVFIHGFLGDDPSRRWGTCASIPVLIAAVARRLRYPVGLAVTRRHVFARWEAGSTCFNIEASNPMGMTVLSDEHYRQLDRGSNAAPGHGQAPFYCRTLYPAEEFAQFMKARVYCLLHAARYEDTLLWAARALQFAPDDPGFPEVAYAALDLVLKHRLWRARPDQRIPPADDPRPFSFDVSRLLRPEERSLHFTIVAHYREWTGDMAGAFGAYKEACRQNFHGNNEQRDLRRFLGKHRMPPRSGHALPASDVHVRRRFQLSCPPDREFAVLHCLAREFERQGEWLKARDALYDLYMLDPTDADVFHRARAIERNPWFRVQLQAASMADGVPRRHES